MDIEKAYELLEVPPSATAEAIRSAYLELVKVWHPDRFQGDAPLFRKAEERQKRLNAAYAAIKSAPLRSGFDPQSQQPPSPPSTTPDRTRTSSNAQPAPLRQAKHRVLDWRAALLWAAITALFLPRSGVFALLSRAGSLTPRDALVALIDLPIGIVLNALLFGALTSLLMRVMHGALAVLCTGLVVGCIAASIGLTVAALQPNAKHPTTKEAGGEIGQGRVVPLPAPTPFRVATPPFRSNALSEFLSPPPAMSPIVHLTLGSEIGVDKRVTRPTVIFLPTDTVYASLTTTGTGTLTVMWSYYRDKQTYKVYETAINVDGPATSEVHVSKPSGWPPGLYGVAVFAGRPLPQASQYWYVN